MGCEKVQYMPSLRILNAVVKSTVYKHQLGIPPLSSAYLANAVGRKKKWMKPNTHSSLPLFHENNFVTLLKLNVKL